MMLTCEFHSGKDNQFLAAILIALMSEWRFSSSEYAHFEPDSVEGGLQEMDRPFEFATPAWPTSIV